MTLPPCRHRGQIIGDQCGCGSPSLVHAGTVPLTFCESKCPFPVKPGIRGAGDLIEVGLKVVGITKKRVSQVAGKDCGCSKRQDHANDLIRLTNHPLKPGVTRWAVGITAAPRPVSTLAETIRTLADTGWCDPLVFAEPGTEVVPGCRWIQRPETIAPLVFDGDQLGPDGQFGAHQNFVQTLADLLTAFPDAEAILYVQDDVRFASGIRSFVERDLWPSQRTGLVSLYCPNFKGYRSTQPHLKRIRQRFLMGGLAYIIPRHVASQLVDHPLARTWKGGVKITIDVPWQRKALDGYAGQVLSKLGLRSYFYSPSVVEHFHPNDSPNNSAVNHGPAEGKRKEFRFIGPGVRMDDIFSGGWMRWTLKPSDHAADAEGEWIQRFPKPPKRSTDPVHVIIPVCGLPDLTLRCLESLKASRGVIPRVCLVDNGSAIEESQRIRDWLSASGLSHTVIRNDENEGFTKAINQGLKAAPAGSHVLILNNDCRVSRDCLAVLKRHLEWHPKTASVCPVTNDSGRCSLQVAANQRNAGISHPAESPDETQKLLTRVHVADLPVLPWFCCLLHRDAVAAVSQLPDDGPLASGLAVDDWWSKKLTKRGWMHLLCYAAFAEHDHKATFKALGINRKQLQVKAVRHLRRAG